MKNLLFILVFILATLALNAQTRVVYGEVNLGKGLKLKNIVIEAKMSGANATSDSLGQFGIVCEQKDVLKFKGKVFKPKKYKVNSQTDSINVELSFKDNPEIIDRAIENGYISTTDVSYAKSKLTSKDIDFCKYNDIYELIQGRIAGVRLMSNNDIIIRGNTSLNGNNPALLVVDGRIVASLSHLSPCDVKKIDFLKSGAGSIYGSRGAGGIVLIETKKAGEL